MCFLWGTGWIHIYLRELQNVNFFSKFMSSLIQKSKLRGPCLKPILLTILTSSLPYRLYQKNERTKPRNLVTKLCSFSLPSVKCLSLLSWLFTLKCPSTFFSPPPFRLPRGSCDRPTRSRFSVVLPPALEQIGTQFHVALHASSAA
jgi:hypothetical protein